MASEYTPALTVASTSSTPSVAPKSPQQTSDEEEAAAAAADFVSRVSGLPIVTTALRAYEPSKASSKMVKVIIATWILNANSTENTGFNMELRWLNLLASALGISLINLD